MGAALELLTAVLVLMNCAQDGDNFLLGRQRNRAGNLCAGALRGFYDLFCGLVAELMSVCLPADTNLFRVGQFCFSSSYMSYKYSIDSLRRDTATPPGVSPRGMKITGYTYM